MTKEELCDGYWDDVLTQGARPQSVYAFCKRLDIEEAEFYQHFASFASLEAAYWEATVEETLKVLEADEDYAEYSADQKLLAFFYTYISHIQPRRSRFTERFPRSLVGSHAVLNGMRQAFESYAAGIVDEGVKQGIYADRKKLTDLYPKGIFLHFFAVINYYLRDTSVGFENTDAFIEKSVNLGSQMAAHGVLESGLDLLRFIVGKDERMQGLSKLMSKFIPE